MSSQRFKRKWPFLEFHLSIPLIKISTQAMKQAYDRNVYTYIRVEWQVWKWTGGFNLYRPSEYDY